MAQLVRAALATRSAALSGSHIKAPGFAGGYLLRSASRVGHVTQHELHPIDHPVSAELAKCDSLSMAGDGTYLATVGYQSAQ